MWGYGREERCDRGVHCPDASDESDCPCVRLIPREYQCDDYHDCPDLSDELGCGGEARGVMACKPTQLSIYLFYLPLYLSMKLYRLPPMHFF